ncbi:MAG: hypothetical protein ACR2L4_06455 [Actinomycetota bacterium]
MIVSTLLIGLVGPTAPPALAATPDFPWHWTEREWDPYWAELPVGWGTRAYTEKMLPWFNPSLQGDERAIAWWARLMRQDASLNSAVAIERV